MKDGVRAMRKQDEWIARAPAVATSHRAALPGCAVA